MIEALSILKQIRTMSVNSARFFLHSFALLLAVGIGSLFYFFAAQIGTLSLLNRALIGEVALGFALTGFYPCVPEFTSKLKYYIGLVCLPLVIICGWYFLSYTPAQASRDISARQLASDLITQSTSNGIIEVGFAYPIYTPTLSISNNDLFTKEVNVFLRILDGNNEAALFRAVRSTLPDARLSVEATVNGLLSENSGYLFIPITVPPGRTVEGKVVFIISDLNDGSTFDEALGRRYPAEIELRDPESGSLIYSFPLTVI